MPDEKVDQAKSETDKPAPPVTWGSRLKSALRKLALLCFSLFFAFLCGECAVRLTGKNYEASLHTPHPTLGWAFRPNSKGWAVMEGTQYIEINSDGNRDRERTVEKPANTLRIAVIGDSFPAAYSVSIQDSFWGVLEKELSGCQALAGRKVEVLNFGVGGYGQAQELIMLRERVWKYDPDIVLLSFFGGNDILDNEREVAPFKAHVPPYYLLRDGQLVLDDSFKSRVPGPTTLAVRNLFADVMNRSKLALLIKMAAAAGDRAKTHIPNSKPKDLGLPDRLVFIPPTMPAMIRAWDVTEALIHQIYSEVKAKGKDFRMMIISSPQQVHPDIAEREAFMKELGITSLFYIEERLAKLAEKEGFPLLSTTQPLAEYAAKNNIAVHGFANALWWGGHWNEKGHKLAGEWLAADYCKRLSDAR
ncbi:MAG: SGNH/GDSL hydrolase family protein [Polyangiaceae bacterium]|nr:SGNH/GDSL hydrolase family protein [Polyangiaceae bacterium]